MLQESMCNLDSSGSEGEESDSDVAERLRALKTPVLFSSELTVSANIDAGFAILASHDNNFGKLFLYLSDGCGNDIVIRNHCQFLKLLSLPQDTKKRLMKGDSITIGNVTASFDCNNALTLTSHQNSFDAELNHPKKLTLSPDQLKEMTFKIRPLFDQVHLFEVLELVTREAILDIKTECRMFAQGRCKGCKEIGSTEKPHECTSVISDRLDRVLRDALSTYDKWPSSRAIELIYRELRRHANFFKHEFRHSMAWNRYLTVNYKVSPLPDYVNGNFL